MFGNFAAQAGVIAGKNFASVIIEWNFADVVVLGYDPFPSNINDRPRINTWRSDGTNLNYASGGRYVYYPPNSPTGRLFEPWGNRTTGELKLNIPLIGNTYAGVDAFIPSGASVTFTPPLGPNSWIKTATIPGEDQYQYLLKIGGNPKLKIELNSLDPSGYFEFLTNPTNNINNLMINFIHTGQSNISYNLYGIESGFQNNIPQLISL